MIPASKVGELRAKMIKDGVIPASEFREVHAQMLIKKAEEDERKTFIDACIDSCVESCIESWKEFHLFDKIQTIVEGGKTIVEEGQNIVEDGQNIVEDGLVFLGVKKSHQL